MKSRIQMAGVEFGSKELTLYKGNLPEISGMPGMRIVLHDGKKDETHAYTFKQVVLEIDVVNDEIEQVVYVIPVSKDRTRQLLEAS